MKHDERSEAGEPQKKLASWTARDPNLKGDRGTLDSGVVELQRIFRRGALVPDSKARHCSSHEVAMSAS